MNHVFDGYEPYRGEISNRSKGSLVAFETGTAVAYGLFNAQDRGTLFIEAGTEVYEGMVIGENSRSEDIVINACKKKHLTNTRSSGTDEAVRLITPRLLSLEEAIEFIADDELVEVTPKSIRIRKSILRSDLRAKADAKNK
jgi:GTP-binding protein